MKKRNIYFAALLLFTTPALAQIRTGIKGGGCFSNINMNFSGVELDIYTPRTGLHAGFMAEKMFSAHFGLHTELMYFYNGAIINPEQYVKGIELPEGTSLQGFIDMHTFQLPLYAKSKFNLSDNIRIYLMGGGFATYANMANQHVKISHGQESMKVKWSLFEPKIRIMEHEENNLYMQQRWNAGIAAEAGIETGKGITVGIGFRQILNNMAAFGYLIGNGSIKPTTRMWTASLSVGYFF